MKILHLFIFSPCLRVIIKIKQKCRFINMRDVLRHILYGFCICFKSGRQKGDVCYAKAGTKTGRAVRAPSYGTDRTAFSQTASASAAQTDGMRVLSFCYQYNRRIGRYWCADCGAVVTRSISVSFRQPLFIEKKENGDLLEGRLLIDPEPVCSGFLCLREW